MKKRFCGLTLAIIYFGILMVSLVLINCASTPKGPSPFEGTWFFEKIEERGLLTQGDSLPDVLSISGDQFAMGKTLENPDGSKRSILLVSERFTYTYTDISVGRGNNAEFFKYTLEADRLTLINDLYGKIIWRKGNAEQGNAQQSSLRTAAEYNERGLDYYKAGDPNSAIADFTQAIRLDSNNAEAYYNRGIMYGFKEEYDRAIADFTQALRLNPNLVDAYHFRGIMYNENEDYDKAIADFSQALRLNPNYADAYNDRGYAYIEKDDYDRAIADFTQALRLNPNYANAYNGRGEAYFYKGDLNQAIADFEAALRINPNHTRARNNLNYTRQQRGR